MLNPRRVLALLPVLIAFVLVSSPVFADVYWESEKVTVGIPQQPDGTKIMKTYYSSNASRVEMGDGIVMIMEFDTMTNYQIDTNKREYTVMKMDELGRAEGMSARDQAQMEKMMGSIQVTPVNETKTISGYKCKKYNVMFMMMTSEYWVSKDVKGYDELKRIGEKMAAQFERSPMMKQMNAAAMMDQLDGFPVQTIARVMGGTITTTLKKIETKPLSPDLFKVPAGYAQKQMR